MKRKLPLALAAALAWLLGVAGWIARGPAEDDGARADAALVLGAAVIDDVPSPVFAARIDHAVDLYHVGMVERIVFTGGRSPEDRLSEAEAAAVYAVAAGVAPEHILLETRSRTTRQNLAFAQPIAERAGVEEVLLVSDPLHLRRALAMARHKGFEARVSATPQTRYRSLRTQVPFLAREVLFMHTWWLVGE